MTDPTSPLRPDAHDVSRILADLERRVELQSPTDDYAIHYLTTTFKEPATGELRLVRTYRLHDLVRGGVTAECWGPFDLQKQTEIVLGLLTRSNYRLERMVRGWTATCPECGTQYHGRIWETPPQACKGKRACKGVPAAGLIEHPAS